MLGLGVGARSYTGDVHYSSEYAVGRNGVVAITQDFVDRDREDHGFASYGCRLNADEQRRRFVIKGLLRIDGLDGAAYLEEFGSDLFEDFVHLSELEENGLAVRLGDRLTLTAAGMARSDTIGPWLYSEAVEVEMQAFELN